MLVEIIEVKDFQWHPTAWISVATSSGALETEKRNLIIYSTILIVLFLLICLLPGIFYRAGSLRRLQELTQQPI